MTICCITKLRSLEVFFEEISLMKADPSEEREENSLIDGNRTNRLMFIDK